MNFLSHLDSPYFTPSLFVPHTLLGNTCMALPHKPAYRRDITITTRLAGKQAFSLKRVYLPLSSLVHFPIFFYPISNVHGTTFVR
ncbi:hypothetical protein V8C44DRAFT_211662 [Trichoderma aethiopicum]